MVQIKGQRARDSERRVLRGAAVFRAFDVGRYDVGVPRVFGRGGRARQGVSHFSVQLFKERRQVCDDKSGNESKFEGD